jgi:hypothetical protein
MSDTPTEFSTVHDGEPSIPKAAACSSEGVDMVIKSKQLEPSFSINPKTYLQRIQSPETWGTLSDEELKWAQQFGQSLCWDEYQDKRPIFRDIEQRRERIARKLEP